MLYQYCKNLKIFYETHPDSYVVKNHEDPYKQLAYDLEFIKRCDYKVKQLFDVDYKELLEDYFDVELP